MKKKILITGASKGIGLAVAKKFHEEAWEVIICARGIDALESAKQKLPGLHTFQCDISSKEEVKNLGKTIVNDFGALDVLVNNGGIFIPGNVSEEDDSVFESLMATNLNSAYYLTKTVLPPMKERKQGTIFNLASIASILPYPGGASYSISKYAMLGFSKVLREEMKAYNIRVISVIPGAVRTATWDGTDIPDERFIPAEDIASMIWNTYQLSARTVVEEILIRPALGDI